ncbi:MAG: hypothetical protein IGS54_01455 [Elainella sp. C42_A2020_010]|nr:hypothetical protein [Elainella sp. C42_A2020_010]
MATQFFRETKTIYHPTSATLPNVPPITAGRTFLPGLPSAELVRLAKSFKLPHSGTDTFKMTVPSDHEYQGAVVITLPPSTPGAVASISSQSAIATEGQVEVKIDYMVPPGGVTRYQVRGYSRPKTPRPSPPDVEVLFVRDMQSAERLASLMQSRRRIVLCFEGEIAMQLVATGLFNKGEWKLTKNAFGMPVVNINPAIELVAIIAIIAAMVTAIFVILVIQNVIIHGINHRYKIKINEVKLGEVEIMGQKVTFTLPTLVLELEPT